MTSVLFQLDVLSDVVRSVAGQCEVYLDGGVRTGSDVFKAVALGAKVVFIGRPVIYGLAYNVRIYKQEGLAVANIARDDPSTLPGDDPFPRAH